MPRPPVDRAEIARSIAEVSLLRGSFTLRSGRTSRYYLDKYAFSTRPEILRGVGVLLAQRVHEIADRLGDPIDRLAGAELGGIPLVTVTSLETGCPSLFIRNAKKGYGTAKQLEGKLEKGDRVIFIEDVATTAGQALEAVGVLREAGAEVLAVLTTIDRLEGARENVEGAGLVFESLFTVEDLGVERDADPGQD
jgi:orotate phosphoribosyltransferase